MQLIINAAVIRLLIDDQAFRTGLDDWNVLLSFHRSDFDRDRGKIVAQSADTFGKIIMTNEFWVLTGNEKELPKTGGHKMARFFYNFVDGKGDPQNCIFARKS